MLTMTVSDYNIDKINQLGESVNNYGFMVVFCVIVLILLISFFVAYMKNASKKTNSEIEMMAKERNASLEHNKQMFDLVTKVQTDQVSQLKEMTSTLREMNRSVSINTEKTREADEQIEAIKQTMIECSGKFNIVSKMLEDVLEYVKQNDECNKEILQKVAFLEEFITKGNNIFE